MLNEMFVNLQKVRFVEIEELRSEITKQEYVNFLATLMEKTPNGYAVGTSTGSIRCRK